MKRKREISILYFLFFFFVIPKFLLFPENIVELEKSLAKLSGEKKVEALNQLTHKYWVISVEKAQSYAQEALKLAVLLRNRKHEVIALGNIAFSNVRMQKHEEAKQYAEKTLSLAEEINNTEAMIFALKVNGDIYYRLSENRKSLNMFLKLLRIQEKEGNKTEEVLASFLVGCCLQKLGKYIEALFYYKRYLDFYKKRGKLQEIANGLRYIASVYEDQGDFGTASRYYFKSINILEKIGNKKLIAKSFRHLGKMYYKWRDNDKAMKYFKDSLKFYKEISDKKNTIIVTQDIGLLYLVLKKYKTAMEYYQESIDLIKTKRNFRYIDISSVYKNIGYYFRQKKMYDEALNYYKKAIKINEQVKDENFCSHTYKMIAQIYGDIGKNRRALYYYEKCLKFAEKSNKLNALINLYQEISNVYYNMRDYKVAFKYKDLYAKLREKIFNQESAKKVAEMQIKYETEKKEKEIEVLKKNNRIQQLTLDRQRIIRNAVIIVALLVFIILIMFFKKYRYLLTFWKKKNHIGHYRLTGKIASGGMGIIYKAHDLLDKSRELAVKVLREEYFEDETQKKRFKNEAAIIDQLDHPNIVKVIERGEADGNLYIAMELLEGQNLYDILREEGKFSITIALNIMEQVAAALLKIHQKNIIHRDLKPENIMIVKKEDNPYFVKLLDFGLSKTQSFTRLTKTGMILGTIFYLSPEQILDSGITQKSDIYSLGVIYYEMLSGQKPFAGESEENVIKQILEKEPVELNQLRPDVPEELNKLIKEMSDKKSGKRPSIEDVLEKLKKLAKTN